MPEVSILIPTRNEGRNIAACLDAIFAQQCAFDFEVVIADSGSDDDTLTVVRRYPVRIHALPSASFYHYAKKRNQAASLVNSSYLVFLSADAVPTSQQWLEHLISSFSDPLVAAVYGRQLAKSSATLERQLTLESVYGEQRMVKSSADQERLGFRYYHFSTVNAALRRSVWRELPFPEDLKIFEDVGIAKRILDAGWKIVYEPRAAVFHSHNHDAAGLFRRYFDAGVVWRQLGIWNKTTRASLMREGWRLVRNKLTSNATASRRSDVAPALARDLAKCSGLLLGLHEHWLPMAVKRRASGFGLFDNSAQSGL